MKCVYCNSDNKEGALFCASCGKKLGDNKVAFKRFCGKCGNSLKEGIMFCPNCGEKVEQQIQSSMDVSSDIAKPRVTIQEPKKASKKIVKGIVIAFLIIIAYIGIVTFVLEDEIFDLEEYMSKDKREWIDMGFKETGDYDEYDMCDDGNDASIIFEEGEPYILTIEESSVSIFHGVKLGDTQSEVEDMMKDDYEALEGGEDELVYKHKYKELWVGFEMEGGAVSQIIATTDGSFTNANDD